MINSLDAFNQPLDFTQIYPFSKIVSDIDCISLLKNNKIAVIEIKKDTKKHSLNDFIKSKQYELLLKLVNNKDDIYLIYATHTLDINKNILIQSNDCFVKSIYSNKKYLPVNENETLTSCLYRLSKKERFAIGIIYPDKKRAFAKKYTLFNKRWYSKKFTKECIFNTLLECKEYIKERYKKSFNLGNQYIILKFDENNKLSKYNE